MIITKKKKIIIQQQENELKPTDHLETNTLKIIHSSDIHGFLFQHNYVKDIDQGILAYINYLEEIKKKNKYTLFIDGGDLIQGSPLTYYLNKFNIYPNPIIETINSLQYDIVTLGNHEFNYGLDYLRKSYQDFQGDILCANIKGIEKILDVKPYKIYQFMNLKIGIIGATTAFVPNWEKPQNIPGLEFESVVTTYAKYEKELLAQSDIIIMIYHGGFEKNLDNLTERLEPKNLENEGIELIEKFDSIDILLSGHQHQQIDKVIYNTLIMQPANNAINLNEIEIDIRKKKVSSAIQHQATKFKNPDLNLLQNKKSLLAIEKKVNLFLDKVIGTFNQSLIIKDHNLARRESHPLINFINKVQLEYMDADISATSLFDTAIGFSPQITIRDLIANYPFPNSLILLEINENILKEAIEYSVDFFKLEKEKIIINPKFLEPKSQTFNYDIFAGLEYTVDLRKKFGQRVKITKYHKKINKDKIRLVINNYRASNITWYPMYQKGKKLQESTEDMIEILTNYILDHKNIIVDEQKTFELIY